VDDNNDATVALKTGLEELGYLVAIAHDAPTALLVARSQPPDVALLDISLPVIDGYELAARLHELGVHRFFAITGVGTAERSAAAGFERHFTKPVELDELDRALNGHAIEANAS
jgi:CheY-like chemotaxis protein